jgi:beta-glucosidase
VRPVPRNALRFHQSVVDWKEQKGIDGPNVVLALGESSGLSGEAASRAHIDLPGNQQQLIDRISLLRKPMVLVLFSGRPLVLTSVAPKVDAILEVWFPGTEAGHAIARVLYGEVSPSGKLPMSFPQTEGQEPLYYNQLPTGRPPKNADLNVPPGGTHDGSRAILTRQTPRSSRSASVCPIPSLDTPTLSFLVKSLPAREADAGAKTLVIAKATVTNTGRVAGTEVVQCYVGNRGTSLEQPIRSLKSFTRVTLAPGESKEVSFPLGFEELSFFDNAGYQLIEPSMYNVWIGGSSLAANHAEFRIVRWT